MLTQTTPAMGLALAYSRVSTYEQLLGGNLEDHATILTALAARYGLELVGEPILEQGSGDLEHLEKLRGILEDVRRGRNVWKVLLVKEFSRLGRSFFEVFDSLKILTDGGVRVIAADGLDTANPLWKPFAAMLAYFAETERERIRERTLGGRLAKLTRGRHVVTGPGSYGFMKIGQGRDHTIAVNPEEERVLRRAFDLIVNHHLPVYAVAKILEREGVRSRRGTVIHPSYWMTILRNERLAGRWAYNRDTYTRTPTNRRKRLTRGRDEWIMLDGPRIFSDEEWAALQAALDSRRRALTPRANLFPLTGHIRCAACDHVASPVYRKGGRLRYYHCGQCYAYYPAAEVEDAVLAQVWGLLCNPEAINRLMAEQAERREDRLLNISAELGDIESQLAARRAERQRATHLYTTGRIGDREFDEITRPISEAVAALEERAAKLRVVRDRLAASAGRAEAAASVLRVVAPQEPPPGMLLAAVIHLDLLVMVQRQPGDGKGRHHRKLPLDVSVHYRAFEGDAEALELLRILWKALSCPMKSTPIDQTLAVHVEARHAYHSATSGPRR